MSAENQCFTILGAGGFIGAALTVWLERQGRVVHPVTRGSLPALLASRRPVGHVIDCIGLTGDFRIRRLDTAEAHVGLVARCLAELQYASFLLLSSTRVYARAGFTHEDATLPMRPGDASDLYNLTKLAGEALCLADPRHEIRVARLSNVYGAGLSAGTFLGQVLNEGQRTGCVVFQQAAASAKDYVDVATVIRLLPAIAARGNQRLYNLAAGSNTTHGAIADTLRDIAGWNTSFATDAPTVEYPRIETARLEAEFGSVTSDLLHDLPALLSLSRESECLPSTRHMAA